MGVRKLFKFLRENNLVKEYQNLTKYVNTQRRAGGAKPVIICIDFWLYAHKFTYSYGNMVIGFWNQIIKLMSHKIIPLYVYDGNPPLEKDAVIQHRLKKRTNLELKLTNICNEILEDYQSDDIEVGESAAAAVAAVNNEHVREERMEELEKQKNKLKKSIIHIKKVDIDNVKKFFDLLSIPYLSATGEADALCAKLFKDGYITACLSDDMDMLALGCGRTIKFQDGKVLEFDLNYILDQLELSHSQFVEMCLLFGCDYIRPTFKIENNESYKLIRLYGTIENILDKSSHDVFNRDNVRCTAFIAGYENAKNLLMTSVLNEHIPEDFNPSILKEIDTFMVLKYLKTYGQGTYVTENMERILDSIEYVNFHISKNSFS
ncbi:MAG: putative flap endonuclease 1-like [Hyperionvirus sp.]|uniref:Putative flap endonuclease 1-like n=1 Tax=Hyperionvirus sp. TaxID=2487770 RepID=A0A3G5AB28_9VIRU|nr:MAG: putative flap endonuclease 1-like [Hyperionvirus sp.]